MEPFYLRNDNRSLFCVYHPPMGQLPASTGIVFAYPFGHEFIYSYHALAQLACRLAHSGFHVLRCDFSGCGDSTDPPNGLGLQLWCEDLWAATDELRRGTDVSRIFFFGLRLGATLALISNANQMGVTAFALMDPIVNGSDYVRNLRTQHKNLALRTFNALRASQQDLSIEEIVGFEFPKSVLTQIADIDLLAQDLPDFQDAIIIDTAETPSLLQYYQRLRLAQPSSKFLRIPAPPIWMKQSSPGSTIVVPSPIINALVEWFTK